MNKRWAYPVAGWVCMAGLTASAGDPTTVDDANLRAVYFIDENEGWAVGDDGVILHTLNRGQNWDLQPSGTSDPLTSIQMLGSHEGWIVGRRPMPFQSNTVGRLLVTTVGGIRWLPLDQPGQFSGLNKIRFFDDKKAWLIGDTHERAHSGIWYSTDSGKSWAVLKSQTANHGWLSATSFDFNNGVLVGRNGMLANLRSGHVSPAKADIRPGTALRAAVRHGVRTWVVGDRAHVLYSDDAGVSWQRAKLPIPDELKNSCDFYAVATVGDKVWIAGRPGSIILHSPDNGVTWTKQKSGVSLPIHGMHFASETHGYAVGAMGTLLRTENGGETWLPSWDPNVGRRAAMLFITADPREVPLSAVARYGAEEGYFCVSLGMTGPDLDVEPPSAAYQPDRTADAFRAAGGVFSETRSLFPLSADRFDEPMDSILNNWNKRLESTATVEMVRDIALAIRMYRPYVVVMESLPATNVDGGVRGFLARTTVKALQAAGDPAAHPELAEFAQLAPHRPVKVVSLVRSHVVDDGRVPVISHSASDLGARLGQTFAEVASQAMALQVNEFSQPEAVARFAVLQSAVDDGASKDLLSGLRLRPGAEARRKLRIARELSAVELKQMEQRKSLIAIATQGENVIRPEQVIGGLASATKELSPKQASEVTFQFARQFVDSGRWNLAKDAFEHLVKKYPEQPLAGESLRWLVAFRASEEARRRFAAHSVVGTNQMKGTPDGKMDAQGQSVGVRPRTQSSEWIKESLQYSAGLQAVARDVWSQSKTQLLLASAMRRLEKPENAKLYLDGIAANDPFQRWSRIVAQERFAIYGQAESVPPRLLIATATRSRPKLDGQLGDDCWKGAPAVALTNGGSKDSQNPATRTLVYLRYDDKYLYMAADCGYARPEDRKPAVEKRVRDGDVSSNDRVELFLDVDRDYTTYFRMRVDATGQVAEDCWGDVSWNPDWYVATSDDDKGYRIEAAIPLAELAIDPKSMETQVWSANIQRIIPGRGVLAFSGPASHDPRTEGFVLFRFEPKAQGMMGQ